MYELHYWDGLQGRGEFVRLALEEAAAPYRDVGREDPDAMQAILDSETEPYIPFAPPFLKDRERIISHTANILVYLGDRIGLAPASELRFVAHGLQLTIMDFITEVHDTHHPIGSGLYYEEQEDAARARSRDFLRNRLPKFCGYFERVLQRNPHGDSHAVGPALTYVDLSLFQVVEGLRYAFPRSTKHFADAYPALARLRNAVHRRPNITAYLHSPRRFAFNETGIFRHYPELDRE